MLETYLKTTYMLNFLIIYLIMTVLGAFFTCGFYICSRGEWWIRPDGKWEKHGMIFKEWSLFWEQYRKENRVYYEEHELWKKWDLMGRVRPDIQNKYYISGTDGDWRLILSKPESQIGSDLRFIKETLLCEIDLSTTSTSFRLYVLQPVYMFPSWIRKPLSECVLCMSSTFGSALYWFIILQVKGLFSWSEKENLAKFGFWVIFCLILACYNKFLQQKMRLDV